MFFDRREQAERKRLRAEEEKESENRTQDKANKSRNGTKVDPCRRFRVVSIRFWQMQNRESRKEIGRRRRREKRRERGDSLICQSFPLREMAAKMAASKKLLIPKQETWQTGPSPLYFKVEARMLAHCAVEVEGQRFSDSKSGTIQLG